MGNLVDTTNFIYPTDDSVGFQLIFKGNIDPPVGTEDQDLYVREGDFVRYGAIFYEVVKLIEPKLLFGQPEHRFEIHAQCIRARDGLFNAE